MCPTPRARPAVIRPAILLCQVIQSNADAYDVPMRAPLSRTIQAMALTQTLDTLLADAVSSGIVPGVVAMAADRDGIVYQGAFGRRVSDGPEAMTLDTVVWLA